MKRFKGLGRYQKGVLLFMAVMVPVFAALYAVTIARVGFAYGNTILVPGHEDGNTVYSGRIQGKQASFTVYADGTVEFRHGDKLYGPYTAREDPSAIPDADEEGELLGGESVTGVELRCKGEILFRGCVVDYGNIRWLYNEDGTLEDFLDISITAGNGIITDGNGNVIELSRDIRQRLMCCMAADIFTAMGQVHSPIARKDLHPDRGLLLHHKLDGGERRLPWDKVLEQRLLLLIII